MNPTIRELLECNKWLCDWEDDLIWELDVSRQLPDGKSMEEFTKDELRKVRIMKVLVRNAGGGNDETGTC